MGKKKMSGSREPRKPKKEKAPKATENSVANALVPAKTAARRIK